jgi:hypothetical protein
MSTSASNPTAAVLLLLPLMASCGGDVTGDSATFAVRDSAGVQIAESSDPAWGEAEGWRLSAEPIMQIGEAEGAAPYLLSGVNSATRLGDGTIVLTNSGSHELRFYDSDGRHIRAAGRKGGGPGEFEQLAWVSLLPADTLVAYDFSVRRLSYFSSEGAFVRSTSLDAAATPDQPFLQVVSVFPDGSLVARFARPEDADRSGDGLHREGAVFLRLSSEGELRDTISAQPFLDRYRISVTLPGGTTGMTIRPPLFGRVQVAAIMGDRIVLGSNDGFELGVYTPDGALERLVRVRTEPRPVSDAMLEANARERLASLETLRNQELRPLMERSMKETPHAATLPFYRQFMGDDAGNLWVLKYEAPGEPPGDWTIFDPEGRMLGDLTVPESFRPLHIGADFVLGVWSDELDVERVQMYGLEKGES